MFAKGALTKLFSPVTGAVKLITKGIGSLGTRLGGVAKNLGGKGNAPAAALLLLLLNPLRADHLVKLVHPLLV